MNLSRRLLFILGLGMLGLSGTTQAGSDSIPDGKGEIMVGEGSRALRVFTYKPKDFSSGPVFFVFHGAKRNAEEYRDWSVALADKHHALVAAPLFDAERFAGHLYSWGGILTKEGKLRDRKEWSFPMATEIIQAILKKTGNAQREHYLMGHSGGGQFLSRYVAMEPVTARRVVAANPGTYAYPRLDWNWGYGFGQLPKDLQGEERWKKMLGTPMTVYLGLEDITTDSDNFDPSPEANRQGKVRLDRGRNFFEYGQKLAKEKGWKFNWTKVEVPKVGHDANLMINDIRMEKALGF